MDRPVIRCSACGGPLAAGAMRCAFCGSQLAQAACPACLGLVPSGARHCPACGAALQRPTEEDAPAMKCPGCGGVLGSVRIGPTQLRPCLACGGIWMAKTEFETMARAREARDLFLGSPQGEGRPGQQSVSMEVHYRRCPVCGKFMNRMNYARISGVILDGCRDDGFWFDPDELRKVVVFIETGGLDRAARRQREDHAAAASPTVQPEGSSGAPSAADESLSGMVGEVLFDAARILVKLIR